ncbi:hypothetical protein [Thermus thermophilus]|uniref:hypothetical protein n=1 Tax=Thermus thermophilus TaxID=274 RepID=UPI0015F4F370|nr:hypothetical protein [Thermus thermophilus]
MGKRGFLRREASPKEVLEHCLRLAREERKPWTAMARALLELIAYGLRVLLSLLPPPPGYKAIY